MIWANKPRKRGLDKTTDKQMLIWTIWNRTYLKTESVIWSLKKSTLWCRQLAIWKPEKHKMKNGLYSSLLTLNLGISSQYSANLHALDFPTLIQSDGLSIPTLPTDKVPILTARCPFSVISFSTLQPQIFILTSTRSFPQCRLDIRRSIGQEDVIPWWERCYSSQTKC